MPRLLSLKPPLYAICSSPPWEHMISGPLSTLLPTHFSWSLSACHQELGQVHEQAQETKTEKRLSSTVLSELYTPIFIHNQPGSCPCLPRYEPAGLRSTQPMPDGPLVHTVPWPGVWTAAGGTGAVMGWVNGERLEDEVRWLQTEHSGIQVNFVISPVTIITIQSYCPINYRETI